MVSDLWKTRDHHGQSFLIRKWYINIMKWVASLSLFPIFLYFHSIPLPFFFFSTNICIYVYIYIYIHGEREIGGERERDEEREIYFIGLEEDVFPIVQRERDTAIGLVNRCDNARRNLPRQRERERDQERERGRWIDTLLWENENEEEQRQ